MHSRTTAQYTMPEVIGPTSPPVTDTMTSSSRAMPAVGFTHGDECLPVAQRAEGAEVGIVETVADLGCSYGHGSGAGRVALIERAQQRGDQEVADCGAFHVGRVDDAFGAAEPAAGLGHLPPQQETQRQPERATRRFRRIVSLQVLTMRGFPRGRTVVVVADHVRRDRESFEVGCFELDPRTRR